MARRTKQDAQATREALLDAAEQVFEQRGVSRTSLNHIAETAGLTRGAIYWHFKDKAELFNAMMERVTLPLETELDGLAQCAGDPVDALAQRLARSLAHIASDARTQRVLSIATMMVEHVEDLGPVRERHAQVDAANALRVAQAFECASALRGQPLPAPARELADGLHALVRGLVYSWLLRRSFDLEATARVSVCAYLRGIGLPAHAERDSPATQSGIMAGLSDTRL